MRINPMIFGILVVVLFLGTIGIFQAAGVWSISGKVTASGENVVPVGTDVESIKGWMPVGDIAEAFGVPLEEVIQQFDLPEGTTADTPVKDLESETFDVSGLRDWLQQRTGGTAPEAVEQAPVVSEPAQPAPTTAPVAVEPAPVATQEHVEPERLVNAKATFQNLLDWGVPVETIEKIIGGKIPPANLVIKDYVTGQGMEFSSFKSQLQAAVDQAAPKP